MMFKFLLIITLLFFLFPENVWGSGLNNFVTVVNPVRISLYSTDPKLSLETQYAEVHKRDLPATWLLTYDALENPGIIEVAKNMNSSQEIGLFMEITEKFASASTVSYNKTDSWHRAKSLFLTGYSQGERIKLIDTLFAKYRSIFNFYPSSVGGWWIDSYSLQYMKDKYGVTATLGCADQFSTDGYQIWGTYWSTPYYPSKFHAGMPASTISSKLDLVVLQWAPRDPLNGYMTPGTDRASLYSSQDFFTLGLDNTYMERLAGVFISPDQKLNKFGQLTLGLEGDFEPGTYQSGNYVTHLDLAKQLQDSGRAEAVTMSEFSKFYRSEFPELSPNKIISSEDLLEGDRKSFWFMSTDFRAHIVVDPSENKTYIYDLRHYSYNTYEPFHFYESSEPDLEINIPSIIDSVSDPKSGWVFIDYDLTGQTIDENGLLLKFSGNRSIGFSQNKITIQGGKNTLPSSIESYPWVQVDRNESETEITFISNEAVKNGTVISDFSPEFTNMLKSKKILAITFFIVLVIGLIIISIFKIRIGYPVKLAFLVVIILFILFGGFKLKQILIKEYFISGEELTALQKLKSYPGGKILVSSAECYHCEFPNEIPPAVYFNKRNYISQNSGKELIQTGKIIAEEDNKNEIEKQYSRDQLRNELKTSGATYLYLLKYGNYKEMMPFSPGDLGVEKIYSNAHVEIWRVKS